LISRFDSSRLERPTGRLNHAKRGSRGGFDAKIDNHGRHTVDASDGELGTFFNRLVSDSA
jgi:hypothetical protein